MHGTDTLVEIDVHFSFSSLLDLWSIQVHTHQPHTFFTLVFTTKDDHETEFQSSATFESDENGLIDPASHQPLQGDFFGDDAMSFMWEMQCKVKKEAMFVKHRPDPLTVDVEVFDQSKTCLAHRSVTRTIHADDIIREELQGDIVGTIYYPKDASDLPGLVIVGGSDASVHEAAAALLASQGFAVMALAYFGKAHLPKGIERIPLEYVESAFKHLQNRSFVDPHQLGIIGHSRGAELALLYASQYPSVKAVIAAAPSAIIFSGVLHFQPIAKPAWTYQGEAFPYFRAIRTFGDTLSFFYHWITRKPYSGLTPIYRNLTDEQKINAHLIPVENIQAPILFFAGTDDHVQPAAFFTKRMESTLDDHHEYKHQYVYHEGAGHFSAFPSSLPNLPQSIGDTNYHMTMQFGGTRAANGSAAQNSWEKTVAFLTDTFQADR
ncbi:acyl-CoA thioester hydrolase/BAAT C-terminal domain-containing protein [Bacillus daqingensis]|uniref:Acyl-CoA thioester hydrolase/BAAT C-terminal domain-containing protein n=1 Tax=Bacillus daqingensis TaxID=872396 RepID=A0ABV9NYN1_9BACI